MKGPDLEVGVWVTGDDIRPTVSHYHPGSDSASVALVRQGTVVRISGQFTADQAQRVADRFHELAVEIDRRTAGAAQ